MLICRDCVLCFILCVLINCVVTTVSASSSYVSPSTILTALCASRGHVISSWGGVQLRKLNVDGADAAVRRAQLFHLLRQRRQIRVPREVQKRQRLDVAAEVAVESKVLKRFIIFQLQALKPGAVNRSSRGQPGVNLHRRTLRFPSSFGTLVSWLSVRRR